MTQYDISDLTDGEGGDVDAVAFAEVLKLGCQIITFPWQAKCTHSENQILHCNLDLDPLFVTERWPDEVRLGDC